MATKKKPEAVKEKVVETTATDEPTVVEVLDELIDGGNPEAEPTTEEPAEPVQELPAFMREKKKVSIGGKEYTIDSPNADLLEDVPWGKKKDPVTGKWEDQIFKYLPAKHIYALMDGLFLNYEFKSEPAKFTGEEYTVEKTKWDWEQRKNVPVSETVRVYEKTIVIVTEEWDIEMQQPRIKETRGYAQAVAGMGVLTSDSARNGFMNKLAFRARKEALKNLGKVFRTYEDDEDEVFEAEEIVSVKGKAIEAVAKVAEEATEKKSDGGKEYQAIKEKLLIIKDFWNETFTKEELTTTLFAVKADLKIEPNTPMMDAFKVIFEELLKKVSE